MSQTATTPVTPTAIRLAAILDRPLTASQESLAEVLGVSPRTVRTAIRDLEAAGALRRERRTDRLGHRIADRLIPTGRDLAQVLQLRNKAADWTPEVVALREAMIAAGIECGWGRLRGDVVADLTRWVRELGIRRLVAEAKARVWSPTIRHVAAFLRWWRELRPERRPVCPFHPAESIDRGRSCPECETHRAAAVPMPPGLRERFRRRRIEP